MSRPALISLGLVRAQAIRSSSLTAADLTDRLVLVVPWNLLDRDDVIGAIRGERRVEDSGWRGRGMRRLWEGRSCWLALVVGTLVAGCQNKSAVPKSPSPSFAGISIKVGAIDDAAILAGVAQQLGEWEASRHGDIQIRDEPVTPESLGDVDVVIFSAQRLGDLVNAGVLAQFPTRPFCLPGRPKTRRGDRTRRSAEQAKDALEDTFQYMEIAPAFREHVSRYGPERVALPCGGSALVLVYRRDAFESASNREAARQAGLSLEQPPTTWSQLDALARFFQGRDWNGDGSPDHGIALALGRRRRRGRRRDLSGAGRQPGAASRPLLVPVRCRRHDPADRQPSVCRGPAGAGCPEGVRAPRHRAV